MCRLRLRELYVAVSQFHENPRLIVFATTPIGGLIVWLAATLLLIPSALSWLVPILLIMVMIKPERTEAIMGLGSIWVLHHLLVTHGIWGWATFFAGAAVNKLP